jgi:hypothetical protein
MKIEVSEYYKDKGVLNAYLLKNRENRQFVVLKYNNKETHSMSYAKYLYTSYYKCDIAEGDEVDHIDNDKTNDVIENLQVISQKLNLNKSKRRKELIEVTCPVCGEKFLFELRNLKSHPNPCCSRKCGGIKSHWKNK